MWGIRGWALSHPRTLVRSGVRPGPTTHLLWVRGVRARGPNTNPTARALASWLCALWGRHEGARGGRLLPGCGASGDGRSPSPDHSSFRACGRGPLPTGCGCGGCGHGDPSPTPQRALLDALSDINCWMIAGYHYIVHIWVGIAVCGTIPHCGISHCHYIYVASPNC